MLVPPPLVYVASFLAGLAVERLAPTGALFAALGGGARGVVAGALLVAGVVLGPLNAVRFLFRGTTLNPTKQATVLLATGMYAISRNPMYLGLFFVYAGIAVAMGVAWPLATMLVPFFILDRVVIPFEESQMRGRFGASYDEYCARVGRWVRRS